MIKKITKCSLLSICLILFSTAALAQLPTNLKHIYFFGDSLSDMGNYVGSGTYLDPSAPVTNWTEGKETHTAKETFAQLFTQQYGLNATPGCSDKSTCAGTLTGNDWAISGSTTGPTASTPTKNVLTQVQNFLSATKPSDANTSLYVIWAGPNNLLGVLSDFAQKYPNPTPEEIAALSQQISTQTIPNAFADIIYAVTELYDQANARNFLIVDFPEIDLTPLTSNPYQQFLPSMKSFQPAMRQIATAWNQALFTHGAHGPIESLATLPGVRIYTYYSANILQSMCDNPTKYGFAASFDIPEGIIPAGTYSNNELEWEIAEGGAYGKQFDDPDQFIFFDSIHPTTHAHLIMAQDLIKNAQSFTP